LGVEKVTNSISDPLVNNVQLLRPLFGINEISTGNLGICTGDCGEKVDERVTGRGAPLGIREINLRVIRSCL
jgi:hypothetical protein